ncbi:hypothetical protein G6F59_014796 [Rhizopus arrhizus]|nr:hypothetical protein G6F59_014796 [Rhizopus arrhizus]
MMGQADPFQIGVAIAQRRHRHPRGNPSQCLDRIGVALHLVARGVEHFIRRLQQVEAGAAAVQGFVQGQPAQCAQVVMEMRMGVVQALAQFAHRCHRIHRGGGRAVFTHPLVQDQVDAGADRSERPQRVVKVESDGLDGEIHPTILRLPARAFIPAGATSPACRPAVPAPA